VVVDWWWCARRGVVYIGEERVAVAVCVSAPGRRPVRARAGGGEGSPPCTGTQSWSGWSGPDADGCV
jgi:hypothetical protein